MPLVVNDLQSLKELIGKDIGVTEWFFLSQDRIDRFAEATEDRQWIHVSAEKASKESPYGATIAHGFLTLSLVSHFVKTAIEIQSGVRLTVNYGLNRVRFPTAVPAGTNIRARVLLKNWEDLPNSAQAIYAVTIETEGSTKPACVAEWIVRYYI